MFELSGDEDDLSGDESVSATSSRSGSRSPSGRARSRRRGRPRAGLRPQDRLRQDETTLAALTRQLQTHDISTLETPTYVRAPPEYQALPTMAGQQSPNLGGASAEESLLNPPLSDQHKRISNLSLAGGG